MNEIVSPEVYNHPDTNITKKEAKSLILASFRDPTGTRTQDPNIKSVVLYQLSY